MSVSRLREDEHSPQITALQREVQQLAIRRRQEREQGVTHQREERRTYLNGPHMPPRLSNSSLFRTEQSIRQEARLPRPNAPPVSPPETSNVRWNGGIAASQAANRQQIIDIQREVEQQAIRRRRYRMTSPHMSAILIDNSTIHDGADDEAEYIQKIIDRQRVIEQQSTQLKDERQPYLNAPYLSSRFINSSTDGPSFYTNSSYSGAGVSNDVNYPHAPPATPDDGSEHSYFPSTPISKDDGLPSYDEAIAFD